MIKPLTVSLGVTACLALAIPASACDFHGGGFSPFGIPGANWQPYHTPDYSEESARLATPPPPAPKSPPSFSNAASRAAKIAKSRVAKKAKDTTAKKEPVKTTALNTDR